jgi:uncharacterized membrane protein YfcA
MDPGPVRDALTLVTGVATGTLSAAFGVGGTVLSTPVIRALGLSATLAIGTTLPSILPGVAAGASRYVREGLVDGRVVAWTAPVGMATAVGGALLSRVVPGEGHLLMVATALLLAFTAWRMSRPESAPGEGAADSNGAGAPPPPRRDTPPVLLAVGGLAGFLSGLLGVGGGTVLVPGFTEGARLPLKTAIATSLACVGIFAVPGTIAHAALGGVDWRVALFLTIGVVPGARAGAALALRTSDRRLRLAVAGFLGAIAVVYLVGELAALLAD